MKALAALAAALAGLLMAAPAQARIEWQPSHGWQPQRTRQAPPPRWPSDYGIIGGRCDSRMVGALLGAAVGGHVGAWAGGRRPVAFLAGPMAGGPLGARLGGEMDAADRGCIGHALELAPANATVAWARAGGRIAYALTPLRHHALLGQACREFMGRVTVDGRHQPFRGMACRAGEGVWKLV